MSCTSVIFLVRLELSQGFNWNPDFKETPQPIQATPPPAAPSDPLPPPPSPTIPSPPLPLAPLAGSTHVHSAVTTAVSQSIAMRNPPAEIDFAAVCSEHLGVFHLCAWWLCLLHGLVARDTL